jgi:predicted XRE-type DNA-binding protein
VKRNIFDALGFSASEATALKIKSDILSTNLEHIQENGYTQAQFVERLDGYLPSVRNLLR